EDNANALQALEDGLGKQGLVVEDLAHIYITHAHVDHIGMASSLAKRSGATVHVSNLVYDWAVQPERSWQIRKEAYLLALERYAPAKLKLYMNAFTAMFATFEECWGIVDANSIEQFSSTGNIRINGKEWRVIHAPGHCSNQTVFFHIPSKTMLSADMLLKVTPTPVLDDSLSATSKPAIQQLLESYDMFQKMDINTTLPGHYEPFGDPTPYIEEQTERIKNRKEQCFQIIVSKEPSFFELLNTLYENRVSPMAFSMLVGYLQLLEVEERIKLKHHNDQVFIKAR
ncbi:MAG: MBL fold metallo-hydrolase, partial [Calditrichota bacterium]